VEVYDARVYRQAFERDPVTHGGLLIPHERRVDMPRSAVLESQQDDLDEDDWDEDEDLDGDVEELDVDGFDSDLEDEDEI
jgi:hypothetical protein